jgi:regulator of sigma E protease
LSVDGQAVRTWDELDMAVLPKANREIKVGVERAGQRREVAVTPAALTKYEIGSLGIGPVFRPQVIRIYPGGAAERADLQRGDVILGIDGARGLTQPEIIKRIQKAGGQALHFTIERNGETQEISVTPDAKSGAGMIGAIISSIEVRRVDPTLLQAFGLSARQNWETTVQIGRTLRGLFTADTPVRTLIGPVGIAEFAGGAAQLGWLSLFEFMVMLSLNLGLINLLPIPVLDGGHIAILALEGVVRRDLSTRVKERILLAGAAVIVFVMVTVIYNDVARLLR